MRVFVGSGQRPRLKFQCSFEELAPRGASEVRARKDTVEEAVREHQRLTLFAQQAHRRVGMLRCPLEIEQERFDP
ncbi:MAG: hypothetical protein ACRDKS_13155, partial [Actinomycetota bacterium]